MGTRSLTVFYDSNVKFKDYKELRVGVDVHKILVKLEEFGIETAYPVKSAYEIAVLYRQMDGYPSGHGLDLYRFLKDFEVGSGITLEAHKQYANGFDCLAAQVIAHFKTDAGGFYLHPAGTRDCWEDYIYHIYPAMSGIGFAVEEDGNLVYDGLVKEFCNWSELDA